MDTELRTILLELCRQLQQRLERQPPADLPPTRRAILNALTDEPQSSKALAHKAGRRFNSTFMAHLRGMVGAGLVRRTAQGYSRP